MVQGEKCPGVISPKVTPENLSTPKVPQLLLKINEMAFAGGSRGRVSLLVRNHSIK